VQLKVQRRLAAEVLGVGESRIWIDPAEAERVANAITREDVRKLIKDGVIRVIPEKGASRGRYRIYRLKQRRKGLRKGPGSRKGPQISRKELWMIRIRAIRRFLKFLRRKRIITPRVYRKLYMMAKGGAFKSVRDVKTYIKEQGLARR